MKKAKKLLFTGFALFLLLGMAAGCGEKETGEEGSNPVGIESYFNKDKESFGEQLTGAGNKDTENEQDTEKVKESAEPTVTPTPTMVPLDISAMSRSEEEYEYDGLKYQILDEKYVEIIGASYKIEYAVIPSEIEGKPVVSIGEMVFYDHDNL